MLNTLDMNSNRVINGADAINPQDFVTLKQLQENLTPVVSVGTEKSYSTLAALLADAANLNPLDVVKTFEYSTGAAAGSGNFYVVVPVSATPEDGGVVIKLPLNPSYELLGLFLDGSYFAKQWGVVADGSTDDTAALDAASAWTSFIGHPLILPTNATSKADWTIPTNTIAYSAQGFTLKRQTPGSIPTVGDGSNLHGVVWDAENLYNQAINLDGVDGARFELCGFSNGTAHGVESTAASLMTNCRFERCTFLSNGSGTASDAGISIYASGCTFQQCLMAFNDGLGCLVNSNGTTAVSDSNNFFLCNFSANNLEGFQTLTADVAPTAWARVSKQRLELCTASGNGLSATSNGFDIQGSAFSEIQNCNALNNSGEGIAFRDGRNNRLIGGSYQENDFGGLLVEGDTGRTEDVESGERFSSFSEASLVGNGDAGATATRRNGLTIGDLCEGNTYRDLKCGANLDRGVQILGVSGSHTDTENEMFLGLTCTLNVGGDAFGFDTVDPKTLRGFYYRLFGSDVIKIALEGEHEVEGIVAPADITTTAATLAIGNHGSYLKMTYNQAGAASITDLDGAWEGRRIVLDFVSITGGGSINFTNSASLTLGNQLTSPYTVSQDDILEFVYRDSQWKLTGVSVSNAGSPSAIAAYGGMYFNGNATVTTQPGPTTIQGTYIAHPATGITHLGGVLTYTSASTKDFLVNISYHVDENDSSQSTRTFQAYKNASTAINGLKNITTTDGNDGNSGSVCGIVSMAQNDTLEVKMSGSDNDSNAVTDFNCTMVALN
jgi:parallel beta-helix repeat protein